MKKFIVIEDSRLRNEYDGREEALSRMKELSDRYDEEVLNEGLLSKPKLGTYLLISERK